MLRYMPRVYDSDVSTRLSPYRFVSYCFPHQSTRSAHATGDFGAPYRACIHFCESTTDHLTMSGSSLEGRDGRLTLPRGGLSPPTSYRLVSALSDCPLVTPLARTPNRTPYRHAHQFPRNASPPSRACEQAPATEASHRRPEGSELKTPKRLSIYAGRLRRHQPTVITTAPT